MNISNILFFIVAYSIGFIFHDKKVFSKCARYREKSPKTLSQNISVTVYFFLSYEKEAENIGNFYEDSEKGKIIA